MAIVYLLAGVILGTFIPMPYQNAIRDYVKGLWGRLRTPE